MVGPLPQQLVAARAGHAVAGAATCGRGGSLCRCKCGTLCQRVQAMLLQVLQHLVAARAGHAAASAATCGSGGSLCRCKCGTLCQRVQAMLLQVLHYRTE